MNRRYSDLPDWSFEIEEVSNGVYEVIASDSLGRRIVVKGTDPDALLEECNQSAKKMTDNHGAIRRTNRKSWVYLRDTGEVQVGTHAIPERPPRSCGQRKR